jgi:hypothetical protein
MSKPARPILTLNRSVPAKPAAKPEPARPVLTLAKPPLAAKPTKPGKQAAPLKPQITPEQKAARDAAERRAAMQARKKAAKALRDMLVTTYPATFPPAPAAPVPLACGIREPLIAAVRGQASRATVKTFLGLWTNRLDYLEAIVAGAVRRNLDGTEAGEPTDEQKRMAAERLEKRRAGVPCSDPTEERG